MPAFFPLKIFNSFMTNLSNDNVWMIRFWLHLLQISQYLKLCSRSGVPPSELFQKRQPRFVINIYLVIIFLHQRTLTSFTLLGAVVVLEQALYLATESSFFLKKK